MKIVTKIAIGFTALIIINAMMGMWLMASISAVNTEIQKDLKETLDDVAISELSLTAAKVFERQVIEAQNVIMDVSDPDKQRKAREAYEEAKVTVSEEIDELEEKAKHVVGGADLAKITKDLRRHHDRLAKEYDKGLDRLTVENAHEVHLQTSGIEVEQVKRFDHLTKMADELAAKASGTLIQAQADATTRMELISLLLVVVGLIVGILATIVSAVSINRGLKIVVDELSQFAAQTASASTQLSNASQSLADGTSETAAALEETSASIEEIGGQVRLNTSNTESTAALAQQARDTGERGARSIAELSNGIEQIKQNADKTAKIVKTIDEIAFQTNILALNAAVEAARAGDAGKGFAVVAEEVRNLAQRASEAARSTAEIIEESIQSAEQGVTLTQNVTQVVSDMTGASRKVNDLVGEVMGSSREINSGITQISKAVRQMDQTTQGNAASAEENSALGEEMARQADALYHLVITLESMVRNVDQATLSKVAAAAHHKGHSHAAAARAGGMRQTVVKHETAMHHHSNNGTNGTLHKEDHALENNQSERDAIPLPDDERDTATLRRF